MEMRMRITTNAAAAAAAAATIWFIKRHQSQKHESGRCDGAELL